MMKKYNLGLKNRQGMFPGGLSETGEEELFAEVRSLLWSGVIGDLQDQSYTFLD